MELRILGADRLRRAAETLGAGAVTDEQRETVMIATGGGADEVRAILVGWGLPARDGFYGAYVGFPRFDALLGGAS